MATDLTGAANFATVQAAISWAAENSLDRGQGEYSGNKTEKETLTFGEGDNKGNQIFTDTRIIAADQTDSLDLSGVLTNFRGTAILFAKVHAIFIHNRSDETLTEAVDGVDHTASASVIDVMVPAVGEGATGFLLFKAAEHAMTLGAGDWDQRFSKGGIAVTAEDADILDIIETATLEAAYEIIIVGEVAT